MTVRATVATDYKINLEKAKPQPGRCFSGGRKYRFIPSGLDRVQDGTKYYIHVKEVSGKQKFKSAVPRINFFTKLFYVPIKLKRNGSEFWILARKTSLHRIGVRSKDLQKHKDNPEQVINNRINYIVVNNFKKPKK